MTGRRVVHPSRPELGTGTVVAVLAGKPPVLEVVWPVLAGNGRMRWGHYRLTDLQEVSP